jgi:hypothetical protein
MKRTKKTRKSNTKKHVYTFCDAQQSAEYPDEKRLQVAGSEGGGANAFSLC